MSSPDKKKFKPLARYRVTLYNDEYHSYPQVISLLCDTLKIESDAAETICKEISEAGFKVISVCHFELAETYMTRLSETGLQCTVEKVDD